MQSEGHLREPRSSIDIETYLLSVHFDFKRLGS